MTDHILFARRVASEGDIKIVEKTISVLAPADVARQYLESEAFSFLKASALDGSSVSASECGNLKISLNPSSDGNMLIMSLNDSAAPVMSSVMSCRSQNVDLEREKIIALHRRLAGLS
mmetsp:Transcript_21934/g.60051  ORF Transcript_21934/g.60051 Transcript_21934/m.60051 type:complete len:118 (-) Transcript_21934:797-1150(-)